MRGRLYIGAALAEESISVQVGIRPSRCGAEGCCTYSSTDVLDFLLTQGTSAPAKQYSVLVIHIFLLLLIGPVARPQTLQESSRPRSSSAEPVNSRPHRRVDLHPAKESWCRA